MPSGDRTPSASGFDSRCSPSCSLTRGGPRSFVFAVYHKVSDVLPRASSTPVDLGMATMCAFLRRTLWVTSYHAYLCKKNDPGWDYPVVLLFTH